MISGSSYPLIVTDSPSLSNSPNTSCPLGTLLPHHPAGATAPSLTVQWSLRYAAFGREVGRALRWQGWCPRRRVLCSDGQACRLVRQAVDRLRSYSALKRVRQGAEWATRSARRTPGERWSRPQEFEACPSRPTRATNLNPYRVIPAPSRPSLRIVHGQSVGEAALCDVRHARLSSGPRTARANPESMHPLTASTLE